MTSTSQSLDSGGSGDYQLPYLRRAIRDEVQVCAAILSLTPDAPGYLLGEMRCRHPALQVLLGDYFNQEAAELMLHVVWIDIAWSLPVRSVRQYRLFLMREDREPTSDETSQMMRRIAAIKAHTAVGDL